LSATCFHVELEQFLACFRVARVCQRQLGILVSFAADSRNGIKSLYTRAIPRLYLQLLTYALST